MRAISIFGLSRAVEAMAGRPTKFTPEVGAGICALVEEGITLQSAAAHFRVPESTVHDWLKRGRGEDADPEFAEFAAGYEAALGAIERVMVQNVVTAAAGDWKASAWWLERRRAKDYGGKVAVEHSADEALQSAITRLADASSSTDGDGD